MDPSTGFNAKLRTLDQIEEQIHQVMVSAHGALMEVGKDKPSIKHAETQVSQFLKALESVEAGVSKQLQYLSQTSTLQPHEGSCYASLKVNQMASLRLEHVRNTLNELEHLKVQHQLQFQKLKNAKLERTEKELMQQQQQTEDVNNIN